MRITSPRGMRIVSSEGRIPLDDSIVDRQDRPVDALKVDALAYSFYALLDDAELRDVFGNLNVAANESD